MRTFQWSAHFETGLTVIDGQHQELVGLINRLGHSFLVGDASDERALRAVFDELAAYAELHFTYEESLMYDAELAPAYIERHHEVHAAFGEQLAVLWESRNTMENPGEILLGFLVAWLGFHILREDQAMARQMAAIRAGASPEAALASAHEQRGPQDRTAALVDALQGLYQTLSLTNRELTSANRQLEERVAERTRSLAEANDALRAAYRQMEDLARVDGLLSIANRRHFDERFEQEWRRAQRERTPLSLLMIDVDHFKLYNDAYGHQAGDDCLRAVTACVGAGRRPADLLARYGGEELVMMLPNTPSAGALVVAREVCASVERAALSHRTSPVAAYVTVSVGVATRTPHACGESSLLIADADAALYAAKDRGRARAVAAGDD